MILVYHLLLLSLLKVDGFWVGPSVIAGSTSSSWDHKISSRRTPKQRLLFSTSSNVAVESSLTEQQEDFVRGYLNKHHPDFLCSVAATLAVADEMANANAWSGRSYNVINATAIAVTRNELSLLIVVQKRGTIEEKQATVDLNQPETSNARRLKALPPEVPLDSTRLPIDDVCRKLSRLGWMVGHPEVSGKLIQLAIQLEGANIGKLPENM